MLSRTLRAGSAGAGGILDSICARRSADRQVGTEECRVRSNKGMGLLGRDHLCGLTIGVIWRLPFERRAKGVEQAIADAAQGPGMTMAAPA